MANDKSCHVDAHRYIRSGSQTAQPQITSARVGKYRLELFRCCEVNGIIEPGIGTYASLKVPRPPINSSKQLNLEPTLVVLHGFRGRYGTGQLGNSDKANRCDEIYRSLWDPNQRTDLTYRLQSTAINWSCAREIGIKRHCDSRT